MRILATLIAAMLIISCKKSGIDQSASAVEQVQSIQNFTTLDPMTIYDQLTKQSDAYLYLYTQSGIGDFSYNQPRLNCVFKDGYQVQDVRINNVSLQRINATTLTEPQDASTLKAAFGHNAAVEMTYTKDGQQNTASFVLPVTTPLVMPEQDLSSIYPGKTITWIKEPSPDQSSPSKRDVVPIGSVDTYVLISLSYDPNAPGNRTPGSPITRKYPTYHNIIMKDAGAYTLTRADLQDFPVGARIWGDIYRGGLVNRYGQGTVTDQTLGQGKIFLGSYSVVLFNTTNK